MGGAGGAVAGPPGGLCGIGAFMGPPCAPVWRAPWRPARPGAAHCAARPPWRGRNRLDADHLGAVHQPVDQRDHAGLAPFGKGLVGGHHRALVLVTPADQLEQEIGVAVGVRQVAHLVDQQQVRRGVLAQAAALGRLAVQRGQLAQQIARRDE
jgi:hypothetical protein